MSLRSGLTNTSNPAIEARPRPSGTFIALFTGKVGRAQFMRYSRSETDLWQVFVRFVLVHDSRNGL